MNTKRREQGSPKGSKKRASLLISSDPHRQEVDYVSKRAISRPVSVSACPTEICTSPDELDRETWNRVYLEAHLANLMEEASQSQNFPISRGKRGEAKQASKLLLIL